MKLGNPWTFHYSISIFYSKVVRWRTMTIGHSASSPTPLPPPLSLCLSESFWEIKCLEYFLFLALEWPRQWSSISVPFPIPSGVLHIKCFPFEWIGKSKVTEPQRMFYYSLRSLLTPSAFVFFPSPPLNLNPPSLLYALGELSWPTTGHPLLWHGGVLAAKSADFRSLTNETTILWADYIFFFYRIGSVYKSRVKMHCSILCKWLPLFL